MQQLMVDRRRDGMEDGSVIGKQNGRHREAEWTQCNPVCMHLHEARICIPAVQIHSSLLNSRRIAQSTQIKTDALDGSESSPLASKLPKELNSHLNIRDVLFSSQTSPSWHGKRPTRSTYSHECCEAYEPSLHT